MYRALREAELQTFVDEHWLYLFWRGHRPSCERFARNVYGPRATSVEVTLGSFYTDEYFMTLPVRIAARDAQGVELVPDITTPWWQAQGGPGTRDLSGPQKLALIKAAEGEMVRDMERTGLPFAPTLTIPLQEPARTYPKVFIQEPAGLVADTALSDDRVPSGYRSPGEAQIAALVADYHENYAWLSVVAFARDVYGASAAVIEFPAPQSGKTDYYYGSIGELGPAAYDAEGEQLEPDLSTTWWRRVAATRERDDDLEDDRTWRARQIRGYFTVLSQPSVEEMSIDYEQWIEEYVPDRRVRTDRPPRRGIETLYVRAADHADPAATFRQYPLPADPGDYDTLTTDLDSDG